MVAYYTNEGAFDLPGIGFEDRTVNVFEADLRGNDKLGFIVCRTKMPEGKSLRDMVVAHVTHEAKRLRGYAILDDKDATWAGVPAIDISSRWRHEGQALYQRQAHLVASGLWILFGMTAPLEDRSTCDDALLHVLSSFRLHEQG